MRLAALATSCALLAACFSKPTFTGGGDDTPIDAPLEGMPIDAPFDGPPIDPASPALIATGGGGGGTGGHACRITAGKLLCWGSNSNGQLGRSDVQDYSGTPGGVMTPASDNWTSVATGILHTCGVHMGKVWCWGQNFYKQANPSLSSSSTIGITQVVLPGADAVDRVFAGGFTTCAIKASGDVFCWGDIHFTRETGPSSAVRLGAAGTLFTHLAIADDHACAIATGGVVHCWGEAEEQQTGQGDEAVLMFSQAKPITGTELFTSLSAGHEATCGTTMGGKLICWGSSNHGQLGPTSPSANGHAPLRIGTDIGWTAVAVGARQTCGVRNGDVYCFGFDQYGALGDGTFNQRLDPLKVETAMAVSQIAASDGYTCALSSDGGTMKCWGSNAKGEIGNKEASRKLDPVEVMLGGPALQIVTGDHHTCALVGSAVPAPAYCWGDNGERQAGSVSSQTLHPEPVQVSGGYTFSQLAAGGQHTCGITSNDTIIACWGNNVSHQLGSTNGAPMATVSTGPLGGAGVTWKKVAAGSRMSCGITSTNKLYCWGLRAGTTVATGTPLEYASPSPVTPPEGWKSISIGSDFAVGVLVIGDQPRMYSFTDAMAAHLCAANLPSTQTNPATPHEILAGIINASLTLPTAAAAQHNGAHSCVLRTAVGAPAVPIVSCFGSPADGRTGAATTCGTSPDYYDVPAADLAAGWTRPMVPLHETLFTASDHSCALEATGRLICWGQNSASELGRSFPSSVPTPINAKSWVSIAGAFQHTCGIDNNNKVFCWGENQYGQVGDGSSYEPSPVVSGVP